MLEESRARIEQNNISNNGIWQLKVLGKRGQVQAAKNWWGKETPDATGIIGSVKIEPVLKKPVHFNILK